MTYHYVWQDWDVLHEPKKVADDVRLETPEPQRAVPFGIKLQNARIERRMRITEVASALCVSVHMLAMYENLSEMPPDDLHVRLCEFFDIPMDGAKRLKT